MDEREAEVRSLWLKTVDEGELEILDIARTYRPRETLSSVPTLPPTLPGIPRTEEERTARAAEMAPTVVGKTDEQRPTTVTEKPPEPLPSYDMGAVLGQGGMGIVYRARQKTLDREVAIKVIRPEAQNERTRERFVAEARTTGCLDHPNIVPVHELGTSPSGEPYLAMKLVGGVPWKDLLDKGSTGQGAEGERFLERHLGVLASVCNAVAFAHKRGIVHCDLKPENVMVGELGEVLVMDWGIAVSIADEAEAAPSPAPHRSLIHAPMGTPSYMPPELANGDGMRIDERTDVYLLGATLHRILTGRAVHVSTHAFAAIIQASMGKVPTLDESLPSELREICLRALSPRREDRFPTALAFREAIEGHVRHRESTRTSDAAKDALEQCTAAGASADRNRVYADFALALAGFQQAQVLWNENEAARSGERRARLLYARAALGKGDLGLAESLAHEVPEGDAERAKLEADVAARRDEIARHDRSTRLLRRVLKVGLAFVVLGVALALFLIERAEEKAVERQHEAEDARSGEASERARAEDERDHAKYEAFRAAVSLADRDLERLHTTGETRPDDDPASAILAATAVYSSATELRGTADSLMARHAAEPDLLETARLVRDVQASAEETVAWAVRRATRREARGGIMGCVLVTRDLAWSPDGREIVAATDHGLVAWNRETGAPRFLAGPRTQAIACAFSPDGREFVAGFADGSLRLYLASGALSKTLAGHHQMITRCSFSRDGTRILSSANDQEVRLWDSSSGELLRTFGTDQPVFSCALSPDGTRVLAATGQGLLTLWDSSTGARLSDFQEKDLVRWCGFSPDGSQVLAATEGKVLVLRDLATGAVARTFSGHGDFVPCATFTPDGKEIVSASHDGTVKVWDRATGNLSRTLEGDGSGVWAVAVSPDGRELVSTTRAAVSVREIATGKVLLAFGPPAVGCKACAFSPDGRELLGTFGNELELLDRDSGKVLVVFRGHTDEVSDCAFSPDGLTVLSASDDKTVKLWNRTSGELLRTFAEHGGAVTACAFSPDGRSILSSSVDQTLVLRDMVTGKAIVLRGHTAAVRACALDDRDLLSASDDGTIRLWDRATGNPIRTLGEGGVPALACALSPDGRAILSGHGDGKLRLWGRQTGELLRTFGASNLPIGQCAFSPGTGDEVLASSPDLGARLWDRESGRLLRTFRSSAALNDCAFSPEGNEVLTAASDGTLRLWARSSPRLVGVLSGHTSYVMGCAFLADGEHVVSASADRSLGLWDVASGTLLARTGLGGMVSGCAYSPAGDKVLLSTYRGTLETRDRSTGFLVTRFLGHTGIVSGCAFSPNGTEVLSCSSDRTLRLWNAGTGDLIRTFQGHTDWVFACAFSRMGDRVLSASLDGTVKLWDKQSGKLLATFDEDEGKVFACALSPDGEQVLSGSEDGTLSLRDAATGKVVWTLSRPGRELAACAFSHDGKTCLASAVPASAGGFPAPPVPSSFEVIDRASGTVIRTLETSVGILSCAFSPHDDEVLGAMLDGRVAAWDPASGKLVRTYLGHTGPVVSCAYSPEEDEVLAGSNDGTLLAWEHATGKPIVRTSHGNAYAAFGDGYSCCAVSPAGSEVAAGSEAGTVDLWDIDKGRRLRQLGGSGGMVRACAYARDGSAILLAGEPAMLALFDPDGNLVRLLPGHDGAVTACAFTPDGTRIVSGSADKTIKLWDRATGKVLWTRAAHLKMVRGVAVSPDGVLVASASDDQTLKLWDAATGALIRTIEAPRGISACAFSPDGTEILGALADGTLRIWDRAGGRLLRTLEGHDQRAMACAFSPDGGRVVSASVDKTLRVWNLGLTFSELLPGFRADPVLAAREAAENLAWTGQPWLPDLPWLAPPLRTPSAAEMEARGLSLLLSPRDDELGLGAGAASGRVWLRAVDSPRAMMRLAWAIERGLGGVGTMDEVRALRAKAAAKGDLLARGLVADAAKAGDPLAQVTIAVLTSDVPALERAADRNEPDALLALATLFPRDMRAGAGKAVALEDPLGTILFADALASQGLGSAVLDRRALALSSQVPVGALPPRFEDALARIRVRVEGAARGPN